MDRLDELDRLDCIVVQSYTLLVKRTKGQKDKRKQDKRAKGQMDKRAKGQKDKSAKGQKDKGKTSSGSQASQGRVHSCLLVKKEQKEEKGEM